MYKYTLKLTNKHYLLYQGTEESVMIRAFDDDDAIEQAKKRFNKQTKHTHGILSTFLSGRMRLVDRPGFTDYLILTKENEQILVQNAD